MPCASSKLKSVSGRDGIADHPETISFYKRETKRRIELLSPKLGYAKSEIRCHVVNQLVLTQSIKSARVSGDLS